MGFKVNSIQRWIQPLSQQVLYWYTITNTKSIYTKSILVLGHNIWYTIMQYKKLNRDLPALKCERQ